MINSANLNFDPVLFGDEGNYYCNVTSRDEVAHSLDATLTGEFSAYVATVTVYIRVLIISAVSTAPAPVGYK